MSTVLKISPVTRVEGHLEVELTVDTANGQQKIVDAKCTSPMFRGFENILAGRDPRDATHFTQRICGVCPVSHGMAASLALEAAFGVKPTDNGRILRNLVLGANFVQSHILHFYHLTAPDYINTTGILDMSPWKPQYTAPDMATGATASMLIGHYVQALAMRRKAHQMGAIFGGKLPDATNFVPGGSTETVTASAITQFSTILTELRQFIDDVYLADIEALVGLFPEYVAIGKGCGNLLAYGVFDLDVNGATKLFSRGRYTQGADGSLSADQIREYVAYSWYKAGSGNLNPGVGVTQPSPGKAGAYSWIKAPRYQNLVYEVGPLARMWVSNYYREGISVLDRVAARALEAKKVADAMVGWLQELQPRAPVYNHSPTPVTGTGVGLTEAPRGALGHWLQIANAKISRYQVLSPTGWNASPRDDQGNLGAMENALIGTPVRDLTQPVEPLRVIHSFDPCLSCSVHMLRPGKNAQKYAATVLATP